MRSDSTQAHPVLYVPHGEAYASSPGPHWPEHEPEIVEMPNQRLAVARTIGDPERVMHLVLPALYSSVYKLSCSLHAAGNDFKLAHLRARWPDFGAEQPLPREQWRGIWGLPVPSGIVTLPQTPLPPAFPHLHIEVETWEYGSVAQIVHKGPSLDDECAIETLREFIAQSGYEIAGPLEEEFLVGPDPSIRRVLVRYCVREVPFASTGPALRRVT